MATALLWRLPIMGFTQCLTQAFNFAGAAYLVSRVPWSTVRMENRPCGGI